MRSLLIIFLVVCPIYAEQIDLPSVADQSKSESLIKEVYKDDFIKASTSTEKNKLADQLYKMGLTENNISHRYVLYRMSMEMASQAGDYKKACRTVNSIVDVYKINASEFKAKLVTIALGQKDTNHKELVPFIISLIDEGIVNESFQPCLSLAVTAQKSAELSKDKNLIAQVGQLGKLIDFHRKEYDQVQAAQKILTESPEDVQSNLIVGKYLCFIKNDWASGLLHLSKNTTLKSLAEADLNAANDTDLIQAADGWWDIAVTEEGVKRINLQKHAGELYQKCLPNLTGFSKDRVEKRLADIKKQGEILSFAKDDIQSILIKKFQGRAKFNKTNGELTFTYGFKENELQDFDFSGKPVVKNNNLIISSNNSIRHVAIFKSFKISGKFTVDQIGNTDAGTKVIIRSTEGPGVSFQNWNGTLLHLISKDDRRIKNINLGKTTLKALPIVYIVSDNKVSLSIPSNAIEGSVNLNGAGQVQILGSISGIQVNSLVISGIPDEDWLKNLLVTKKALSSNDLIGKWEHKVGDAGAKTINLLSGGKIDDPKSNNTWSVKNNYLTFNWQGKIENCAISNNSFIGSNSNGDCVSGKKINP